MQKSKIISFFLELLRYPPFCDIILIGVSSKSEIETKNICDIVYKGLKDKIETQNLKILLYKPVPSPIDKIKNKFRWRIIVKCKTDDEIINELTNVLNVANEKTKNSKNETRVSININPSSML